MNTFLLILTGLNLLFWLELGVQFFIGINKVPLLKDIDDSDEEPKVSVIIAARNEENAIESAVKSLLNQKYNNYELIVVNDRSNDKTGLILDTLKISYSNLTVVHIKELPPGWLGKNHALYIGALQAKSDWILFTDGDIIYSPQCLSKSISYVTKNNLDHLTMIPSFIGNNFLVNIFTSHIFTLMAVLLRPWQINNPKAKTNVGLGAFNLVKSSVYKDVGTHQKIALRPDDDNKLGKIIKDKGYKQQLIFGKDMIVMEWYENVKQMVNAQEKTSLVMFNYRLILIPFAVLFGIVIHYYPFIGVFIGSPVNRIINLIVVVTIIAMYYRFSKFTRLSPWHGFFHPFAAAIASYGSLRGSIKTLRQGGVNWRGTIYPLDLLKKNVV